MNQLFKPCGIYSAQWIPTNSSGQIDQKALLEHVEFERTCGIQGILALGSTGEFPYFSLSQKKRALNEIAAVSGSLPVIANITDIRPQAAIELGLHAKSLGMAAVALMPPTFYPKSQADTLAHFLHIADAVGLPVMLYNFPELVGKRIDLETIEAFAKNAPLVAVKQSGAEFDYHRELITLGKAMDFVVMSGADTRLPEVFRLGAAGCIGGLVNIVPEVMVALHRIGTGRSSQKVEPLQDCMVALGCIVDELSFPLNIAAGMEARGFYPGASKAVVSSESRALYGSVVARLKQLFDRHELLSFRHAGSAKAAP